jgi:hypothetical protein
MYAYPVLLPAFSNREDFLLTVSIFDDDTGDAIALSGTSLAVPGDFTSAAWTVVDGAIVTTSTTSITIPDFPIGGQLAALALNVGIGLGILGGDPITIFDTLTGKNTMTGYVSSYVPSTGALVVQIGMTFQFEIRSQRRHGNSSGYSQLYDIGVAPGESDGPILSASLGNGIAITDIGFLQIRIPEIQVRRMRSKTYLASLTMTDSIDTRQVFIAKLPEQYGGVTV